MKINHRIAARYDEPFWLELDRLGLDYEHGDPNNVLGLAISVLNITEDQPQWPKVQRLIAEHDVRVHSITNLFSKREVNQAEWLQMSALGQFGYPQPVDDYREITYDVSQYCDHCGIGGVQNAPFRLRSEPKARHSQFVQLNWVFDEFFVRREARQGLTAAGLTGFDFRPAVIHRKDRPSGEIEQMEILSVLQPALNPTGLQTVTCKERNEEWESKRRRFPNWRPPVAESNSYCGRVKFHLESREPLRFDRSALAAAPDVVKSHEWFGSGGSAFRLVLVSQRFRRVVLEAKWRGLFFEPVELIDHST
ncbi:MAG: hypothetical protein WAM82_29915 [Thermoanaerobaculia bacterium]